MQRQVHAYLAIGGHGIYEGQIAADVEVLVPAYGRFHRVVVGRVGLLRQR